MFAPQAQTHLSASLLAKQHLLTFELALALRVTLQKPLDVSGRLPAHLPVSLPGVSHSSAQLTEKVGACLSEMVGVLDAEVGRKELSGQKRNRELERDSEGAIDLDSAWELISSQQQQLQPKWEAVTNKWHARLNFGSEKAKAKMKTFTHSLWDQVGDTLLDERRAKEKSRLPLADSRRVDVTRSSRSGAQEESAPGESAREVAYDEEVYDDRMFYALLLKVRSVHYVVRCT
ncbi:hypothetical protein B484DRAFT_482413 [Ochromonadaceae sp. CCMP2298]|nr:hypothetical protein B484DRAFT_482413 [Ochromonadaceae sp. CCMP2298]